MTSVKLNDEQNGYKSFECAAKLRFEMDCSIT